jgi:hypothetical protein
MFEKSIGQNCQLFDFVGAPYGIRTRVSALRGPHPDLGSRCFDSCPGNPGRGSQEVFVELAERSCINVFGLSLELIVLPTIMAIGELATSVQSDCAK